MVSAPGLAFAWRIAADRASGSRSRTWYSAALAAPDRPERISRANNGRMVELRVAGNPTVSVETRAIHLTRALMIPGPTSAGLIGACQVNQRFRGQRRLPLPRLLRLSGRALLPSRAGLLDRADGPVLGRARLPSRAGSLDRADGPVLGRALLPSRAGLFGRADG